jgi:hypothetical protein
LINGALRNQIVAGETHLGQSTEKTVIVEALDLTFRTIEKRVKRYRYLVISVVCVIAISPMLALFYRQWLFTAGWILLVPLIGGFSYFDSRAVRLWRRQILQMNRVRDLDIDLFLKTAAELKRISPPTLQRMLSTINTDRRTHGGFDKQQRSLECLTLVATILLTAALGCLVGAAYYHSLIPLPFAVGLILFFSILRGQSRRSLSRRTIA